MNRVFRINRRFKRTPPERRVARRVSVGAHLSLQESLQVGERSLPVLILEEDIISLHTLHPSAETQQVSSMCQRDLIAAAEEVTHRSQITSGIRAAICDLRCSVERSAAADNNGADGLIGMNPA